MPLKSLRPAATALALVLALGAAALPGPGALAQGAPAAATAVAPLSFTKRVLPNGLTVYAMRDTATPNVSVQVWYGVGSKDDPKGRSGFAHLFEHMMFKSTRNMVPEQFDRLTEDVGGMNNASTADDYTDYYSIVPANHLERILWAEADRMGSLVIDQGNMDSERDVVKEELRQRVLAEPYGRLFYLMLTQASFQVHPYARPGIGSIEELDAATLDDVRAFHATYYRPDNATLVVAGNFDPARLDAWVDQYFGKLKKPATAIPRVTAVEPERKGPRTLTAYQPNVPLPAVLLSFPFPAATSPDIPALVVLDAILSKGQSSRLYQSLVYSQQVAQEPIAFQSISQQPSFYAIGAILAGDKTAEQGEKALLAELAKLRDAPVTAAELAEAKNELVTESLRERETADGKARALARGAVVFGDPNAADTLLARVQAVTPADIQRVARTWLDENKRVAIRYLPEEGKPADAKGDVIETPATVQAAPLVPPKDLTIFTLAPEAEREKVPEPGKPISVAVPAPAEKTLPNGLRVVVVRDADLPLLSVELSVAGGAATDPAGLPGVASITTDLLTKGTRTRSATEIAQAVEALGGTLGSAAGWDGSDLSLVVKADQAEPALAILADLARNPAFAAEELERLRRQALDDLTVALKRPGTLASLVAQRAVFGAAPYGHARTGTPSSLEKLSTKDVAAYHQAWWRPDNATLVLAGDLTPEAGFKLAEKLFGDWQKPSAPLAKLPDVKPLATPQVLAVDLPKSGQAAVVVARPGLARDDKDYYPALVANAVLGVGYSARLNQEIRIKRGLSYGARSSLDVRREPGPLAASTQTKNQSATEVAEIIFAEMKRLGSEPIPAAELASRKAVLVGGFGRALETTEGFAGLLGTLAIQGVPLAEVGRYMPAVEAVTAEQVRAAAQTVLNPEAASLVVVGDAETFAEGLKQKYPSLRVIPAAKLDLDKPGLE